ITTPGRAVMIVTRQRLVARSIKILGTDAPSSFFFRNARILRSSVNSAPNSFLLAYHFERQSLLTATRRPIGFVFWPMRLFVGNGDLDMATAFQNWSCRAARLRLKTFQRRRGSGNRFLHAQRFRLEFVVVFRVGDGRFQSLRDKSRAFARNELQHRHRFERAESLHLPPDLAHFLRGHRHVFHYCKSFHKTIWPPPWPCARRVS